MAPTGTQASAPQSPLTTPRPAQVSAPQSPLTTPRPTQASAPQTPLTPRPVSPATVLAGSGPGTGVAAGAALGVGLTPRLFEALVGSKDATLKATSRAYVPAIRQHVQSVKPSKQVMAEYWCPIIVESEGGARRVLHVDPLAVRKFRRSIAEELRDVQEKRHRMRRRIQGIRHDLPPTRPRDLAIRLGREIRRAEQRADELLVQPLPQAARVLHVLVEASTRMVQLKLVCDRLMEELPAALEAADVQYLTLTAVTGGGKAAAALLPPPLEEPLNCSCTDAMEAAAAWLQDLAAGQESLVTSRVHLGHHPARLRQAARDAEAARSGGGDLRLTGALRRLVTADALGPGGGAVLLVACSPPSDLEGAVELLRRSQMIMQIVGVFGVAPEDPEPALQRLADASAPGSSLRLFFGPEYWLRFAEVHRRRLEEICDEHEIDMDAAIGGDLELQEDDSGGLVDARVFEMRLIERIMRECYVEEQRCEEELACASQVLNRTLLAREDVKAALWEELT